MCKGDGTALVGAVDDLRLGGSPDSRSRSSSSSSSSSSADDSAEGVRRFAEETEDDSAVSRPMSPLGMGVVAAGTLLLPAPPAVDMDDMDDDADRLPILGRLPPPAAYEAAGRVLVCQGKACTARGGQAVLAAAAHAAAASPGIEVVPCKCMGRCKQGPALRLRSPQATPSCAMLTQVAPLEVPEALDTFFG